MIETGLVETNSGRAKKGLYESFYFRGTDLTGGRAFWLKHNLLLHRDRPLLLIESTLVIFKNGESGAQTWKHQESLPLSELEAIRERCSGNWEKFSHEFKNGSFVRIFQGRLQGVLFTKEGKASWDLVTEGSKVPSFHFSKDKYYRWAFPKKKILTHDIAVRFRGSISAGTEALEGEFLGMNGHNWGTEHAWKYQYANCNVFTERSDAYFDGFSGKIALFGPVASPYLSCCSLKIKDRWFCFNDVASSFTHKVHELTGSSWRAAFRNRTHVLEVEISGDGQCWVELPYLHPDGKISRVKNTKFAQGRLRLFDKKGRQIEELTSGLFELESLLPPAHFRSAF